MAFFSSKKKVSVEVRSRQAALQLFIHRPSPGHISSRALVAGVLVISPVHAPQTRMMGPVECSMEVVAVMRCRSERRPSSRIGKARGASRVGDLLGAIDKYTSEIPTYGRMVRRHLLILTEYN